MRGLGKLGEIGAIKVIFKPNLEEEKRLAIRIPEKNIPSRENK